MTRIGFGYDIHTFAQGRPLILGGVCVPFDQGLEGHSDADVLLHAICDALLGAAGLGDIGVHFPDTDTHFHNAQSTKFLEEVFKLLRTYQFQVVNVDSTVVLQGPKIGPYIPRMKESIAQVLQIEISRVSIKATTNEGLGELGKGKGCAAYAVALIQSN